VNAKILNEGKQIHNFISSSGRGSGTVIIYGSGSGSGSGSISATVKSCGSYGSVSCSAALVWSNKMD
jgi:hypothetical protein